MVLYPYTYVYIPKQTFSPGDDYSDYWRQTKGAYVLNHALSPLFGGLAFLFGYCYVKDWVDVHANQDRTWGW